MDRRDRGFRRLDRRDEIENSFRQLDLEDEIDDSFTQLDWRDEIDDTFRRLDWRCSFRQLNWRDSFSRLQLFPDVAAAFADGSLRRLDTYKDVQPGEFLSVAVTRVQHRLCDFEARSAQARILERSRRLVTRRSFSAVVRRALTGS